MEPAHKASVEDWETMIDTNNKGLVYMTRAVLPGMVERNHGHIINIGSTAGSWPYAYGNVYGATKAFVRQFSLNLRTDLHGTAVRVTDIEPGLVGGTEFSNVRFKGDDGKAEKTYQNTVALTPEDVSEAVWWVSTLPAHVNINTLEMILGYPKLCRTECPPSVIFIPGVTAGLLLVTKSGRLMQLTHSQARTNDRRNAT